MTNTGKLLRRMHVKVRRHDQLVEKGYSRDVEPGENSVPVLLVFNGGKKGNTRNKLHWKNKATGEQRTFTSSPDHMGIYPWIATEAAKSHAHAVEMNTYLDWIWDVTGILYCKHQTHNWTTQEHKSKTYTYLEGTANPKCLTCSRAKRCKRHEVAPTLLQRVSHTAGFTRRARIDNNTRLTGGIHFDSMSFRVNTPDKLTSEAGREGGKPMNKSWFGYKILGQPLSTSSPNLGPRTGFGRTQEPCVFCITRNSALWCAILHSLIETKEHLCLIFPCF